MESGSSVAQFLELDNKSPRHIELSASPALVSVCIGCSLSLQLSAWGGTVNDGFVLSSLFVWRWFLEQRKQAYRIYCTPPPPSPEKWKHSSLTGHSAEMWTSESFDLYSDVARCLWLVIACCVTVRYSGPIGEVQDQNNHRILWIHSLNRVCQQINTKSINK